MISAGSGRVRKEHADAIGNQMAPIFDADGDFDMANLYDDGMQALPDAEPFPMMSGALAGNDKPQHLRASEDRLVF